MMIMLGSCTLFQIFSLYVHFLIIKIYFFRAAQLFYQVFQEMHTNIIQFFHIYRQIITDNMRMSRILALLLKGGLRIIIAVLFVYEWVIDFYIWYNHQSMKCYMINSQFGKCHIKFQLSLNSRLQQFSQQETMNIFRFFRSYGPEFKKMGPYDINPNLMNQYNDNIFLTPRYQKISYSEDMLKYLRFLQRKKTVSYADLREFVQHLLTEYHSLMQIDRPGVNILMQKDVTIPKCNTHPYHGKIDWVYSIDGFNPTPVMHSEYQLNASGGIAMAVWNMFVRMQRKKQFENRYKSDQKVYNHANSYDNNNVFGYSIITTGHEWQLIRVNRNFKLQKSIILQAKNKYRTIYHDEQLVTVLLGMLDYCVELPQINVRVLQKAYQYIDQRKYMIEGVDQDQANSAPPVSKLLTKYYKKKL